MSGVQIGPQVRATSALSKARTLTGVLQAGHKDNGRHLSSSGVAWVGPAKDWYREDHPRWSTQRAARYHAGDQDPAQRDLHEAATARAAAESHGTVNTAVARASVTTTTPNAAATQQPAPADDAPGATAIHPPRSPRVGL